MLEVALVDKIHDYKQKVNHLGSFLLAFLIKYYCYLGIQHVVDRPKSERNREITRPLKKNGGLFCIPGEMDSIWLLWSWLLL
ncbi:hypothetical protein IX84_12575 [Phaeodactylibacter xiamenensis]|uniref:Uncharacterized protein n=1 Tax=Phaeodactylibacter xiamenensis TaxID=1524460 RepID=A0A098S783_9BACT|nr:hypothetical protein IX84_12575 [Phaeodactylibacter xiamenensis]